jgi:HD-like signal output (HDOD) protein
MQLLKLICQSVVGLLKQAWRFPHSVALALRQKRRQLALNLLEAERLDRIRNPSKYLGKS